MATQYGLVLVPGTRAVEQGVPAQYLQSALDEHRYIVACEIEEYSGISCMSVGLSPPDLFCDCKSLVDGVLTHRWAANCTLRYTHCYVTVRDRLVQFFLAHSCVYVMFAHCTLFCSAPEPHCAAEIYSTVWINSGTVLVKYLYTVSPRRAVAVRSVRDV